MALRLTQVAPGVHRLDSVYTNWYLLEAGGRLTVLDAGLPGDWREFSSALSRLGHTPGDIDAVLITHHHVDHAGNAERLRSSGARVLSHPADAPYLRGEESRSNKEVTRFLWRPWYALYLLRNVAKGATRTPHAPGHTPGSCGLLIEDRSLLFSGDALVTVDMVRGPSGRSGPQVIRGPHTVDADLAVESLDVLAATNAETVLPGHGEPWAHGVKSAVDLARQA